MLQRLARALAAGSATLAIVVAATTGTAHAANPPTDLLWFDAESGEVSTWLLNGYGNVLGTQSLDWRCDTASTCAYHWRPIGVGDLNNDGNQDLLWYSDSGQVSTWLVNGHGTVVGTQPLDWHCDYPSGCASDWHPVGVGDLNNDGNQDLVWYDPYNGEVSTWLLNGYGNVLRAQPLDWRCDTASTCAAHWRPIGVGDLNNDGNQDLMWFNADSGEVSTWLLNGYGNVLRTQSIDWHCDEPSLCSGNWHPVGVGDLNNDGKQDLMWHNRNSGEVSTWLLNGYGNVLRAQPLDWHCDYSSGCAYAWQPVDLVD